SRRTWDRADTGPPCSRNLNTRLSFSLNNTKRHRLYIHVVSLAASASSYTWRLVPDKRGCMATFPLLIALSDEELGGSTTRRSISRPNSKLIFRCPWPFVGQAAHVVSFLFVHGS